jgi:CheY-like chemotaxis protein
MVRERRPAASRAGTGTRFRLRFAALAVLVAAVPLVVAAWAVVRLVSDNERDRVDSALTVTVGVAAAEYKNQLVRLDRRAEQVASRPDVNRAIVRGDLQALRRYVQAHPTTSITVGKTAIEGSHPGPMATQSVVVARGDRELGSVTVGLPLDQILVERISPSAMGPDDVLALTSRGRVVAGAPRDARVAGVPDDGAFELDVRGTDYRAATADVPRPPAAAVVASRPQSVIDSKANDAWWAALWAAIATLATVAALAFLVAPVVSGRRWVRRLLPWELEEQYAVDGDGERFAAPVPSHGTVTAPDREGVAETATAVPAVRYRVVVIDDDPEERTLIADALGPDGIDVAATGDAEQGLGLLGAAQADLAILDWKMSGRSGAEILAEVNIRHPDVPVLVVADYLEPQQQHVASLLGAGDFLVRPLDPAALLRKAQELLDEASEDSAN